MRMELPRDPAMLLSFVNMKLRDFYPSLQALCEDIGAEETEIKKKLADIDYEYDPETNRFI